MSAVNGGPNVSESALETRIVRRRLRDLQFLDAEDNARFMGAGEFKILVENLRLDGVLTSSPLVYRDRVLSGNHRVEAALAAGIEEADVIEVTSELTPERATALQLSHNAIVGGDDPGKLQRAYAKLDLDWRRYSGLTDANFKGLKELDITSLALGAPKYHELHIMFLPEEEARFLAAMKGIESKLKRCDTVLGARFEDFRVFFDAMVETKKVRGIVNSAVAVRTIAEIALAVLEAEVAAPGYKAPFEEDALPPGTKKVGADGK